MSSGEESVAIATGERPKQAASRARSVAAMTVAQLAGRCCRKGNDDDDVCSAVAMYGRCCSHEVAGLQLRAESTAGCCPVGVVLECIMYMARQAA